MAMSQDCLLLPLAEASPAWSRGHLFFCTESHGKTVGLLQAHKVLGECFWCLEGADRRRAGAEEGDGIQVVHQARVLVVPGQRQICLPGVKGLLQADIQHWHALSGAFNIMHACILKG